MAHNLMHLNGACWHLRYGWLLWNAPEHFFCWSPVEVNQTHLANMSGILLIWLVALEHSQRCFSCYSGFHTLQCNSMSKKEKLLQKLRHANSTFAWTDLRTLLSQLGFEQYERAGSRVVFMHKDTKHSLHLHKPHPENHIKGGALKAVKHYLTDRGDL